MGLHNCIVGRRPHRGLHGGTLRAIDVSLYQKTIDWQAVKNGLADGLPVAWAFIKCGQRNYNDPFFKRNWTEAKRAGVKRGAYWYSDTRHDPIAQAWLFWNSIKDDAGEARPVIDIEQGDTPTRADFNFHMRLTREFESVSGITPIIYTRAGWWNPRTDGADYSRYPLWVANYRTPQNPITKPTLPRGWTKAAVWQYTDSGRCSGIVGPVDCNEVLDADAIALTQAPPLPDKFPIRATTSRAAIGYRKSSGQGDTLMSVDLAGVSLTVHDIDTERRTALASVNDLRAWYPLDAINLNTPQPAPTPTPAPQPVTPTPQPIKLGYNCLNAGMAMAKADAGCRFFMLQDVNVARQIKRKYPDAVVMVRWYHGQRVTPDDVVRGLSPSLDDELVFTGLNECDWLCYGTIDQLRERAAFDVAMAQRIKERSPKSVYAAGTFSVGTPNYIVPDICEAMRQLYALHYNSGLMSIDYHSYTPSLTSGFDIWYARRWQWLFDKCGFDVNSTSRIYSGETGVDDGKGNGFTGVGATQAQVNDWVTRFKALQSEPINGKPSPFVGGAIFALGENGDKRWLPFKTDGYEVFR